MGDNTTGDPQSAPSLPQDVKPSGVQASNGSVNRISTNGAASHSAPPAVDPHAQRFGLQGEPPHDGLVQILSRQWHVVALITLIALMLGMMYLFVTHPVYTASSTMKVEPLDPAAIGGSNAVTQADASDFLDTECVVIKSSAVLALAVDKLRTQDLRTMRDVPRPLEYLKQNVDAGISKAGKAVEVKFDSRYPNDAVAIVAAVVDSYREYNSTNWTQRAKSFLNILQQGKEDKQGQMADLQRQMLDIARKVGHAPNIDPSKDPAHQLVESLRDAKMKATLHTIDARNSYQDSAKSIIGDPEKVKLLDQAERNAIGSSTDPQGQLKTLQDELFLEQAKLEDAQRQYMPAHPVVKTIQRRIDQLTISAVVAAKQWEQSAISREESLDHSLHDAEQAELELVASEQEYARLEQQLKGMKDADEDIRKKAEGIDLSKGAGALNISVLNPAEVVGDPKPAAKRTLGISFVLGIIGGLGIACLRDWTDDRLRTPHAIQAVMGVPVLGTIPAITNAYTAADRGQIVHHEPFGDAAESYRTLRTALQFSLPAGSKTLLVTSPVAGDGKSTLLSNLAIAIAQAGKRVLIIDADLRAPMQHRLFGLKDVVGLSTVLGGPDTMQQAIQHTGMQRLDVIPCGPIPSNPAEMLNDPLFLEHLNDLADKYDLILIDSPPVTAVTDARILAASVDASLLVVRPLTSTRKQTEAARDGLRSVGARLLGVAVNAVPRNGSFGGPSGYYPRSEDETPPPPRRHLASRNES